MKKGQRKGGGFGAVHGWNGDIYSGMIFNELGSLWRSLFLWKLYSNACQ